MIDTHTHIYEPEFSEDLMETVRRAGDAGVDRFVFPAIDSGSFDRMMNVSGQLGGRAFPCIGLHPTSVNGQWREEMAFVRTHLKDRRWTAIGEIGLDGHWSKSFMEEQKTVFREQMDIAFELGWPVILHVRDATVELYEILDDIRAEGRMPRGVFHAFSGSYETYCRLRSYGDFLFGIGGVVTYRNSQVACAVARMDMKDMVLETDAPYLPPVPFRGCRNEPSYLTFIASRVSSLTGTDLETVKETTTHNAERMFLTVS